MIALIYFFWVLNIVFTFFVLCNFLIAMVGESFQRVLGAYTMIKYKNRAILNREAYLTKPNIKEYGVMALSCTAKDQVHKQGEDGFIHSVRGYIKQ